MPATTESTTLYECHNKNCALGARNEKGYFTGGTSEALAESMGFTDVKLRSPENETGLVYGDGICPSCGVLGKEVGDHKSVIGEDPYAELHEVVNAEIQKIKADAAANGETLTAADLPDTREMLKSAIEADEKSGGKK